MQKISPKTTMSILLIEEDENIFNSLSQDLGQNIRVNLAKNAEEGIHLAKEINPDIIITNLGPSRINGFEVIKNIKMQNRNNDPEFIILSDLGEVKADISFLNALGIKQYLVKSNYAPWELTRKITEEIV